MLPCVVWSEMFAAIFAGACVVYMFVFFSQFPKQSKLYIRIIYFSIVSNWKIETKQRARHWKFNNLSTNTGPRSIRVVFQLLYWFNKARGQREACVHINTSPSYATLTTSNIRKGPLWNALLLVSSFTFAFVVRLSTTLLHALSALSHRIL